MNLTVLMKAEGTFNNCIEKDQFNFDTFNDKTMYYLECRKYEPPSKAHCHIMEK